MNKLFKVLLAFGLTVLMATPALAKFTIYGSVRMTTYYQNAKAPSGTTLVDGKDSYSNLTWAGQHNSRLGAMFKDGSLYGRVELGLKTADSSNEVYTRLIYGLYTFDGGSLLVGQTYTPYTFFSRQVWGGDHDFIGWGATYGGRQPMVEVSLDDGLYLATITPKTAAISGVSGTLSSFLPKVAVGYNGKFNNIKGGFGFAYNGYTDKDAALNFSKTINSYLAYVHGVVDLKPFDVSGAAHYGQNLSDFGLSDRESSAIYDAATNNVQNTNSYGGFLQLGYQLARSAKCYAGVGYVHEHNKLLTHADIAKTAYFVNTEIHVLKNFMIVPEVDYFQYFHGYTNTLLDGASAKNAWAFGAKWQMDF